MKNFINALKCPLNSIKFAIPPLLTILLGKLLFETLAFDFPQLNSPLINKLALNETAASTDISLYELKARLLWLSSVLLYFFVNLGFICFLWTVLKKTKQSEFLTLLLITACLACMDLIYFALSKSDRSPLVNIFHFSFDTLSASGLFSPLRLTSIHSVLNIINLLAIVIIPFSIVSGCCIIKQKASDLHQVNKQFLLLKEFIKGASAILIVGIIHMQLWLSWPLSLSPKLPELEKMKSIIAMIIQYWGICYSLTIAAFYLPVAAHLRHIALEIEYKHDSANINEHNKQLSNTLSLIQPSITQLTQVAVMLGPMLVGTISPALTNTFAN